VAAIFGYLPGIDARPLAAAAAERAVQLDPTLAEAHHALGAVHQWLDWDLARAEPLLLRAVELNPRMTVSRMYLSALLAWTGRTDGAIREARHAIDLEPESALLAYICGNTFYWSRRLPEAREQFDRALALDPGALFVHWWRPVVLAALGEGEPAAKATEDALRLSTRPAFLVAAAGRAYGAVGRIDEVKALVDEMLRRRPSEYVAPIHIADAYVAMGDRTRACDFFEQALTDRNAALAWGPNTPFYDVIRDEPRFAAVMKHVRP